MISGPPAPHAGQEALKLAQWLHMDLLAVETAKCEAAELWSSIKAPLVWLQADAITCNQLPETVRSHRISLLVRGIAANYIDYPQRCSVLHYNCPLLLLPEGCTLNRPNLAFLTDLRYCNTAALKFAVYLQYSLNGSGEYQSFRPSRLIAAGRRICRLSPKGLVGLC